MIDDALMVLESDPSVSKDRIEHISEGEGDLLCPDAAEPVKRENGGDQVTY